MLRGVLFSLVLVVAVVPPSAFAQTPPDSAPVAQSPDDDTATAEVTATAEPATRALPPGTRLARAEAVVLGFDAFAVATLLAMPTDFSNWERPPFQDAGPNLRRAWTSAPVVDHDSFVLNWIGHPYAGSLTYNAMRAQGSRWYEAFLFSTFQSLFWEYAIEATMEQPSLQDLLITSNLGSLVGEGIDRMTRRLERGGFGIGEATLVSVLNPTNAILCGFRPDARARRCPRR